jgi:hypothetical protein
MADVARFEWLFTSNTSKKKKKKKKEQEAKSLKIHYASWCDINVINCLNKLTGTGSLCLVRGHFHSPLQFFLPLTLWAEDSKGSKPPYLGVGFGLTSKSVGFKLESKLWLY